MLTHRFSSIGRLNELALLRGFAKMNNRPLMIR